MSYQSIDQLQNALGNTVFKHTKQKKKSAGRALGTIIEIIAFYLLKAWNLNDSIAIERGLFEYGNEDISHNVEYSLHCILKCYRVDLNNDRNSITSYKIFKTLKQSGISLDKFQRINKTLLSKDRIIRNACIIGKSESGNSYLIASISEWNKDYFKVSVIEQTMKPYAVFECKRVGIEEGQKKGPQTIEKAKQGAYVAKSLSSLQKIRTETGEMYGVIYNSDNTIYSKPYTQLMDEIIRTNNQELLRKFILTVGIVSNHGNWFTSENQNKELKVLSQSYDWLLFLTDEGLAKFVSDLLVQPRTEHKTIQTAFQNSYAIDKEKNQFTKVQMNFEADQLLQKYFQDNLEEIESWFTLIAPKTKTIQDLKNSLIALKSKDWQDILEI